MPESGRRRRPFRTLRGRVTAAAAVALMAVLAVSGILLVDVQERVLTENLDEAIDAYADAIEASLVERFGTEITVPLGDDDAVAQLVDPDATGGPAVVAATPNAAGLEVLGAPPPDGRRQEIRQIGHLPQDDAPYRVLSRRVDVGGDEFVLHVAGTLDDVVESTDLLQRSLVVAVPVMTVLLGIVVWVLVGWTLRPVEAAHEQQRRFVADASHELRSPLTRIRTEIEVDLAHAGTADLAATHRSVLDETIGLQRLVDDLMFLARSDAGAVADPSGVVDLREVVATPARTAPPPSVDVDLSGVGPLRVRGDAGQLSRAVGNVVANAVGYAHESVVVTARSNGSWAELTVTDDGPGIAADQAERIFDRFARVDDSRTASSGGTGLGLAIARDIVHRHGGTITVDAAHDAGARFVIRLPLLPHDS